MGRLVNFITFGKAIDRRHLKNIKNMLLLDLVSKVFLSVFDGSAAMKDASESEKAVVAGVGRLPSRIIRRLPLKDGKKEGILGTTDQIETLVTELMYPAAPDNMNTVIAL